MNKPFRLMSLIVLLGTLTLVGCGDPEPTVVEAPATNDTEEEIPAMDGMTDEEYAKAMEEDMDG